MRLVSYAKPKPSIVLDCLRMAEMLTYMENKSTDFLWRIRGRVEFADENYAREIMQLFSIGLTKLNNDGTTKRDANGDTMLTYTNNEITEYARVWTGFRTAPGRGNIETAYSANYVDPMQIVPSWRDPFPKLGLDQVRAIVPMLQKRMSTGQFVSRFGPIRRRTLETDILCAPIFQPTTF